VSKGQTISKLESLLARVRGRAAEPRARAVPIVEAVAAHHVEVTDGPAALELDDTAEAHAVAPPVLEPAVAVDRAPPKPAAATTGAPVFDLDEPIDELESTQQRMVPSRPSPQQTEAEIVVEVDVQASTHETVLAVPVDEAAPVPSEVHESKERLVAAAPAPSQEPSPEPELAPEPAAAVEPEPAAVIQVEESVEVVAEELVEEAPASSRRPVAPPPEERLEEMAFGSVEPEPPRHTPPPESGRLPAAPEAEYDGDITGVRSASKSAHPAAAPSPLVPEATIAALPAGDTVADVVPAAPDAEPTTFVGMLERSLAL
jgi:hypothetical protein